MEGYNVVFIDETWITTHHTKDREWQSKDGTQGRHVTSSKGQRLIILHAGSENQGFIEGVKLIFPSKSTDNRDYHAEMIGDIFEKWMTDQLLPSLDRPSCVVMDNASYHNRTHEEG